MGSIPTPTPALTVPQATSAGGGSLGLMVGIVVTLAVVAALAMVLMRQRRKA